MNVGEVFRMALGALRTNKLRSILTMLGVTIGVFSSGSCRFFLRARRFIPSSRPAPCSD